MPPLAGVDYPGSYVAFRSWFSEDWKCLDYLDWLRWPEGFRCPHCDSREGWRAADMRWRCSGCDRRVSATSGTIFHRTRTSLASCFLAGWHMVTSDLGISAVELRRKLELGSYQTAWALLHRYRSVMAPSRIDRLRGEVELQRYFLGGHSPEQNDGAAPKNVLVAVAMERDRPSRSGRVRIGIIEDGGPGALRKFLTAAVEPGSQVIAVGSPSTRPAAEGLYRLVTVDPASSISAAREQLAATQDAITSVRRWMLGHVSRSVAPEHLQAYLDEWAFRFNHQRTRGRGLPFYVLMRRAVIGDPVPYVDLRKAGRVPGGVFAPPRPRSVSAQRGHHIRAAAQLPWRGGGVYGT